jgi:uncharacterized membrane protein
MSRSLLFSIVLTALAAAAAPAAYYGLHDRLPERVPIHWNIRGEADGFVERDGALPHLLIIPAIMAGMVLLTVLLPLVSPRRFDVDRFRPTWDYLMALVVGMFGYIQAVIVAAALQLGFDINRVLIGGLFLFLAAMGNVLGKVQRNFWMGVRTPWTLASETVWIATHRLAAWLFVVCGLLGAIAALVGLHPIVSFVLFSPAAVVPIVYSLILYKRLERQGKLNGEEGAGAPSPRAE